MPGIARVSATEPLVKQQLDCLIEPRVTIKLGAEVAGLISKVTVDRGDQIRTGQVLAKLKSGVEEANFALAKTKAANDLQVRTNKARSEFLSRKASRQAELKAKSAVAESTFDEASTDAAMGEFATKEAELNWQVAQLEVTHQEELLKQRTILSPIDGVVVERALSAGEYTNETKHILTIAQIDPLNVEVFVPISYYGQTAVGNQAEVFPESPIGGRYLATVTVVDHVMDAASGTFGVRLQLPNPNYLIPAGINCKIRFTDIAAGPANDRPAERKLEPAEIPKGEKVDAGPGAAAERGKKNESEKAVTADDLRATVDRAAAEKFAPETAASEKMASEKASAEKQVLETKAAGEVVVTESQTAELRPKPAGGVATGEQKSVTAFNDAQQHNAPDLSRALQLELRRVGCDAGAADGDWNAASQHALHLFSQHAGIKLDATFASADALDAVKSAPGRVCPLVCERGYRADGDRCTKITCPTGHSPREDGTCERTPARRSARRENPSPRVLVPTQASVQLEPAKPHASRDPQHAGRTPSTQKTTSGSQQ